MKKSDELKQQVNAQRKHVEDLQAKEEFDAAEKAALALNDLVRDYRTARALEESDLAAFADGAAAPVVPAAGAADAKIKNRIFNKLVFGGKLTQEERDIYHANAAAFEDVTNAAGSPGQVGAVPEKGGYLVPVEQMNTLREYRRAYTELKSYCNIIPVATRSGSMPTMGTETGTLTNFEEITDIHKSDIDFGQLKFTIADYGDIIPVARQLIADADVDLLGIIGRRFARKCINTENAEIMKVLASFGTPAAVTGYKDLLKAINVTLDPAIGSDAKIITNQDGLQWLDTLEDDHHRPLIAPNLADPASYVFRGRPILVLSNDQLATTGKKIPFYVGSVADAVAFFTRDGVEVAVSEDFLFGQNAIALRVVERFGVVKDDAKAIVPMTVSVA